MVLSQNVIAFKNVATEVLIRSKKGSLVVYFSLVPRTLCSSMWATPVESLGGVLNPIPNAKLSISFSRVTTLALVFSCSYRLTSEWISSIYFFRLICNFSYCLLATIITYRVIIVFNTNFQYATMYLEDNYGI